MRLQEFLRRYFATRACVSCGKMLPYEFDRDAFCESCRDKWEKSKVEDCPCCLQAASDCRCMPKCMAEEGILTLRHVTFYHAESVADPCRNALLFLKDHRNPRVAAFLAAQTVHGVREELAVLGCEGEQTVVSFLPRTKRAVLNHGFDQGRMLAEALASELHTVCVPLLRRVGDGKEQKKLNAVQRRQEARRQIEAVPEAACAMAGRCVILVDDIVTSGAGMAAGARALRLAGADRIIAVSVATVIDRRNAKVTK